MSQQRIEQRLRLDLGGAEPAQQRVVMEEKLIDLLGQRRLVGEVADADGAPAGLVLVGGADAAAGGADALVAARLLARAVDLRHATAG